MLGVYMIIIRFKKYFLLYQKIFNSKIFSQIFCKYIRINIFVGNDNCKCTVAYIRISLNPAQVRPTLKEVVVNFKSGIKYY